MKFSVSVLVALLSIVIVHSEVTLPCDDLRLEIEALLAERETLRYDRLDQFGPVYDILLALTTNVELLFVAKEAAINSYTAYYNARLICEGLKEKVDALENATAFSGGECLQAPVSNAAENLFNYRLNLESQNQNVDFLEDLTENYFNYKDDYSKEAGLYSLIKGIYTQKVAILQAQYNSCTGAACNDLANQLQAAKNL